jgi:hypothetical protein
MANTIYEYGDGTYSIDELKAKGQDGWEVINSERFVFMNPTRFLYKCLLKRTKEK